jgi:hypothetical protein
MAGTMIAVGGRSKGSGCKALDEANAEAYEPYAAGRREESNAADGPFSAPE